MPIKWLQVRVSGSKNGSGMPPQRAFCGSTPECEKCWIVFSASVETHLTFENCCPADRIDFWEPQPRLWRGTVTDPFHVFISASVHDNYSIGPSFAPVCTRCCLSMTNIIQVCSYFHWARVFIICTRPVELIRWESWPRARMPWACGSSFAAGSSTILVITLTLTLTLTLALTHSHSLSHSHSHSHSHSYSHSHSNSHSLTHSLSPSFLSHGGPRGFRWARIPGCCLTDAAPHEALNLIAWR